VSHSHLRYHITTGIRIGTRIGIGARKKYRVSEVSLNPGIGLSLIHKIKRHKAYSTGTRKAIVLYYVVLQFFVTLC